MASRHPNARTVFRRWKEKGRKDGIICGMQGTINDDETVAGSGKDMILAGRYHILHQLGVGLHVLGIICRIGPDKGGHWEVIG